MTSYKLTELKSEMHFGFVIQILSYVVLCAFEIANCNKIVTTLDLKANYRLQGHHIGSFTTTNQQLCERYCYSFADCKSIDFFKDEKACNLHDATGSSVSNDELVFASGYVFSNIDTWPVELSGSCGQRPCTNKQQCLSSGTSHVCLDIDCNGPGISGAVYNDTATVYKTVLNVSCEDGNAPTGESRITCNADGKWSTLPACSFVVCLECYRKFEDVYFFSYPKYPYAVHYSIDSVTTCIQTCNVQTPSFKIVSYYEKDSMCLCFDFTYSRYISDGYITIPYEGLINFELV